MKREKYYKQPEKKEKHYLHILIKIKNDFRLLINNCAGQKKNHNGIISLALPQHCPLYRGDSHQGHLQTPREAHQKEDQEVEPTPVRLLSQN